VGEPVRGSTADARCTGAVDERHHRNGGAAGCDRAEVGTAGAGCRRQAGRRGLHARRSVGPGGPPRLADRRAIEPLGFEQPDGRRQMFLTLANAPAPRQRVQEDLVHARVERRKLEPPFQVSRRLVVGHASDEVLQQGRLTAAESAPLRRHPIVESGAAVDLQAIEKVAVEQRGQCAQPLGLERLDAFLGRPGDLYRIDRTAGEIEPDGVAAGLDSAPGSLVNSVPDLAQAPAQLAARIVRHIP
jgi:hypothetical protein